MVTSSGHNLNLNPKWHVHQVDDVLRALRNLRGLRHLRCGNVTSCSAGVAAWLWVFTPTLLFKRADGHILRDSKMVRISRSLLVLMEVGREGGRERVTERV